jgi:hypothetical protein
MNFGTQSDLCDIIMMNVLLKLRFKEIGMISVESLAAMNRYDR